MGKVKKPMPRWVIVILAIAAYVLSIALPVAVIAICIKSCALDDGKKEMIAYMDAIESECADYSVVDEKTDGACSFYSSDTEGSVVVQNRMVYIEAIKYQKGYNIKIDETEIVLDIDYFSKNSETFNKIVKLWDDYERDKEVGKYKVDVNNIDINYLVVFDNQIFVCAYYLPLNMTVSWRGCVPVCAFRFDVSDFSLQYVGYSKSYNQYSYLIKSN